MTCETPAIRADQLGKDFGSLCAVRSVDLLIPAGSVFALLGPNGAGKTTTVRLLSTLLRPDRGRAEVFGYDVVRQPTAVRSMIGITGQYASLDDNLSARENLMIFGMLLGWSGRVATRRGDELLEQFELGHAATRPVRTLSGGMRRRLDIATTLLGSPPLIFLDEPTTGLDPHTRIGMWDTVRTMVARGSTVLLTTQYLEEADALADRIAIIDDGTVVAEGTADELKSSIGGAVLRIRLRDGDRRGEAVDVLRRITAAQPSVSALDGEITTALSDVDRVTDVLVALRGHDIALEHMTVDRPDLNEVFLTITGNPIQTEELA
ncbi:ATP-binding cassette domain-containing protein [Nocardia salmonicida]|uniref:ATP-binding cassette domain-containing protein n=1 Tax=Nocardia salmonicida TaxID=53431 RepID=UPI0007A4AAB9|nr:ATP-binding cassette domain-containing protein [Nocardia salmonicida]